MHKAETKVNSLMLISVICSAISTNFFCYFDNHFLKHVILATCLHFRPRLQVLQYSCFFNIQAIRPLLYIQFACLLVASPLPLPFGPRIASQRVDTYINKYDNMGVPKNRGIPKWMVYNEKPSPPLFLETSICLSCALSFCFTVWNSL